MTPPASNFQPPASSSSIQPPASSITLSSAQFTTSNRANWLLAIVSSVIAVGIAELTLRVAPIPAIQRVRMQQAVSRPEEEVHPRGLYTLHPQIGWTLTPGFSGRFRKADFDISVQASRDGLRDRDYGPKPAGTLRVLGLGDSFAFGWGVENEESVFKVLERSLNADGGRPVEVVNGGVPGFGTYEALQLLQTVGLRYEPDLVVLAFYEGNDYQNNGDAPRQRTLVDGYLKDVPAQPPSRFVRWMSAHSVLAALGKTQAQHVRTKRAFGAYLEKTKQQLAQMRAVAVQRGIPLALLFIPDQDPEVYSRPQVLRLYDKAVSGMTLAEARRQLKAFCRQQGIWYCPLSARFEDGPEAAALRLKDTHWNAAGHAAAASELQQFLRQEGLIMVGPGAGDGGRGNYKSTAQR